MHCQVLVSPGGEVNLEGSDVDRPELFCELLRKHNMSLCCVSEHRWRGEGTLQCGDYLYVEGEGREGEWLAALLLLQPPALFPPPTSRGGSAGVIAALRGEFKRGFSHSADQGTGDD